ncbi:hypothetical protein [Wolbachia endosymbiont of Ctenocephalides felis wCfeJ]|uniref:hypothetical protein n=1 Tax=Wolbachia endosymbiont of Ctenocephalides felis wCfeJ TaxID=2732594 RepID=UPI001446C59D|nr:hypothetical protein [Wolbachia endosymbiont of Ctenocephalides felis wCfeJ]WCR57930.1 MAG: hypothetical protein PG980_000402 [Wolbachia endosymbiont of Ctenocephalides felis wCfeJ]
MWKIDKYPIKENLIKKINKITSNMVLTIASAVAGVESVSVLLSKIEDKTLLTIKILSKHKPISKSLVNRLAKKGDISLNTKDINIYMTSLLLEYYNAEIRYSCENNLLEIGLVLT